ncbi:hypothetical protein ABG79_00397 [Caloramator mitchellensis]|uniref:Uncharacterized protein n=1 Tax=Caloramator mitchellensis TaxID=908809 RepID=A0A0R3K2P4_CALMK|nr:hypothetical protein [Caloramator mitchellensis]KRQ87596.1 hypothetical protein ABG79_00397 [Caloramator mitchellensis]
MPAIEPTLTDLQSMEKIMDATANELQGLSWFFCNVLKPSIENVVEDPEDVQQIKEQISLLKQTLCAFTVKEGAIAELIKSVAKKEAVDKDIPPALLCKCLKCEK